jgi:NAD-dependent deacetylase
MLRFHAAPSCDNGQVLEQVRGWISAASSIVALSGSGISAESGVPTFRGDGGLWRNFRPEDLATPEAFERDPMLVWEWYDWRRQKIAEAAPNPGHKALARLERAKADFTLVTQNVDGLHDRAGSLRVLKLHGDIWRMRCTDCGADWPERRTPLPKLPPKCRCGAMARPGVVWFGEPLPNGIMLEAQHAAESAEVLLVVGTSAVVYPAASLIPFAKKSGARIVEVNTDETPATPLADASFRAPAGEVLPQLLNGGG